MTSTFKNVNGKESFEELFNRHEKMQKQFFQRAISPVLKADKGADLDDFIGMIAMIVSKALKKHNAIFIPDEGKIIKDPHDTLEEPTILYKLIERIPLKELKPRPMEEITENEGDETNCRHGMVYGYRQKCILQFDIVASDCITANQVMNTFEEAMFTYTGFFKSKGINEMHFLKHFTDKNLDNYRQDLSIRSLQYYVEIQKLITVFESTIDDINTL